MDFEADSELVNAVHTFALRKTTHRVQCGSQYIYSALSLTALQGIIQFCNMLPL